MTKRITAINSAATGNGGFRVSVVERDPRVIGSAINAQPTERVIYEGESFVDARKAEDAARVEMMRQPFDTPDTPKSAATPGAPGTPLHLPLASFADVRARR